MLPWRTLAGTALAACAVLAGCERVPAPSAPATSRAPAAAAIARAPRSAASAVPKLPPTVSGPRAQLQGTGAELLAQHQLIVPVEGVSPHSLVDTYEQGRVGHKHEALDIMAARGTPVLAVDDGKLVKLFKSVPGGLTVYEFDTAGQLAYYYAHLDRYADGVHEGMDLHRGDLLGYVGSTGDASPDAPHLHFAVFVLGPQKQWWKGEPVNPYAALRNAQSVVAQR